MSTEVVAPPKCTASTMPGAVAPLCAERNKLHG
jgi:hypothetical protein